MNIVVVVIAVALIVTVLALWQIFSNCSDQGDLKKVANFTASFLFWGAIILLIAITVRYF